MQILKLMPDEHKDLLEGKYSAMNYDKDFE